MTALSKLLKTTAFKLALGFFVMFAIGSVLIIGFIGRNVRQVLEEDNDQIILSEINGLSEQYSTGGLERLVRIVERRSIRPGALLYLVTTNAGEKLAGNVATLPDGVLNHPGLVETPYQRNDESEARHPALARILSVPGGFRLLVGRDLEERGRLAHILNRALFTWLGLLAAIGTLGGLFVARRVLVRVDSINAKALTIMNGDLDGRLPVTGTGDELDRLAQSLNTMLDRIGDLLKGLREVSDNIAHDLRTPLTRLRNRAEDALRGSKTDEEKHTALEKVIEESDGLIRVFNALLLIARAEAGDIHETSAEFDLAAVARDVVELYEPTAEEAGQHLKIDVPTNCPAFGNRELISQALANLIDNGLKYGGKTVVVGIVKSETDVELSVADSGVGIPAQDRERALGRFVRLDASRSRPGFGLGLSLCNAVAHLHHGSLRLEDNNPGLKVVLRWPSPGAVARPAILLPAAE